MLYTKDKYLAPFKNVIVRRNKKLKAKKEEIAGKRGKLSKAINNHIYYGVHQEGDFIYFREWAPNAKEIYVIGDFNGWSKDIEFRMSKLANGNWELKVAPERIRHKDLFKFLVIWEGGEGERLPAYATRCVQNPATKDFAAQIWFPENPYKWEHKRAPKVENPLIYEVHIGMSSEEYEVASFKSFTENVLPRIADLGYNTIQVMALQEHPYYGSFGYQVSNFFALSSRFGTPEEFKNLVDTAHGLGIAVIMDIVHSHAVKNENEGLSKLDGTTTTYFHPGDKGDHPAWGTRCFDYGKNETLYFLLSNCKYWMQEFNLDGFRFDGITSMLYWDHGLGKCFTSYPDYFDGNTDEDALVYLGLANILIKEIHKDAFTIAEDMSGMPGLAAPVKEGGFGFDYRMSMGVPDHWIKWIKELSDQNWNVCDIWWQLTNKRADEKTISYAECHDQAMVGDKTIIFRLIDAKMYTHMSLDMPDFTVDRGIALHKMIRLVTLATSRNGYLTFMGNEFGHPEWIDFPREGNDWSHKHARRQWSLADSPFLRYHKLLNFDKEMVHLFAENRILAAPPVSVYNDEQKQVLIMERGGFLFVFNFSPTNSYTDYQVQVAPGEYKVVLDSDWAEFNGFERNKRDQRHFTMEDSKLTLYIPSRSAFVLKNVNK